MSTDPTTTVMLGSCACGANTFELSVVPTQRFYCHCLYCQEFMGKPYTDVTMVRTANVTVSAENSTSKRPRRLPPGFAHGRGSRFGDPDRGRFAKCANLHRARCNECGQAFIEWIGSGPTKTYFIPSANFKRQDQLPPAQRHIYYRLREADATDDLPKHHYFTSSQSAVMGMVLRMIRRS